MSGNITQRHIVEAIERIAPLPLQEEYDNSGLQVGDINRPVSKVLICLDVTEEVVMEAVAMGAEMVVSHHPLLFRPLKRIAPTDYIGRCVMMAIEHGITLYAAHTNLDNAPDGVNYMMAQVLGLQQLSPLHALPASRTDRLPEDKRVMAGGGLIGFLPEPMTEADFIAHVQGRLAAPCIKHNLTERMIHKVAICGGSGSSFIRDAVAAHADAFLTGEIGYHLFFGHPEILLMEAGHYETEQYTRQLLAEMIQKACPEVECHISQSTAQPIHVTTSEA